MARVVVFGTGQIARVARFYLEREAGHLVAGFCVDAARLQADRLDGLPVVAWETLEAAFPPGETSLFAPIGYAGVNAVRSRRFAEGRARGYGFVSFVHPRACYYGTPLGANCFVLEQNVVQPFAEIGDDVILWSGNHVGHHSRIGDHCFVASHVVISGGVSIGERCFLGVNATVRDNVTIGARCVIGAGAVVTRDLPDESVVSAAESPLSRVPSSRLRRI